MRRRRKKAAHGSSKGKTVSWKKLKMTRKLKATNSRSATVKSGRRLESYKESDPNDRNIQNRSKKARNCHVKCLKHCEGFMSEDEDIVFCQRNGTPWGSWCKRKPKKECQQQQESPECSSAKKEQIQRMRPSRTQSKFT
ncbi:hypothetical protein RUM44_002195 [Polyplax serrata]|uniref:Uncharacterized protein n=1 Tax=Polyplax serrata TaxID=468196 RepID=A0ABR1AMJ1_POLSC